MVSRTGFGIIHGGQNALRFTPISVIKSEIDMIVAIVRNCLDHFIAKEQAATMFEFLAITTMRANSSC